MNRWQSVVFSQVEISQMRACLRRRRTSPAQSPTRSRCRTTTRMLRRCCRLRSPTLTLSRRAARGSTGAAEFRCLAEPVGGVMLLGRAGVWP